MYKTKFLYLLISVIFYSCDNSESRKNPHDNILIHKTRPDIKDSICVLIWDTANAYANAGDFTTSLRLLKKCNEIEPNNPTILNALGVDYFANHDSTAALKYYFAAIKVDSSKLEPYAAAGCLLEMQGKYSEALKILKMGYDKSNSNQFTHYNICFNLAITYYSLDSCDQTEKYLKIAKSHGFPNQLQFDKRLDEVDEEVTKYCDYKRRHK